MKNIDDKIKKIREDFKKQCNERCLNYKYCNPTSCNNYAEYLEKKLITYGVI